MLKAGVHRAVRREASEACRDARRGGDYDEAAIRVRRSRVVTELDVI
ncbi:MAG: hypothetical protein ABIJ46_03310 [bacterium]